MDRLNGMSLFSGIGGIDLAIKDWVRTRIYCELDTYCQGVLLSRMQFGMTLQPCREGNYEDSSTLSSVGSRNEKDHARTLALQDMEKAWLESEADYFSRSFAWPKKSSPNSYSLKTQREYSQMEESKLSKRLPPSGIAYDGLLRAVKRLDHPKIVKDGLCLPTPKASDSKRTDSPCERRRHSPDLTTFLNMKYQTKGKKVHPHFIEWMMTYPLNWTCLSLFARNWMNRDVKKTTLRKRTQRLISLTGKSCGQCGSIKNLQRHHPNYTSEDCMIVCQICHKNIHLKEKTWGRGYKKEANCIICSELFNPKHSKQNKLCGKKECSTAFGKLNAAKRWKKNVE